MKTTHIIILILILIIAGMYWFNTEKPSPAVEPVTEVESQTVTNTEPSANTDESMGMSEEEMKAATDIGMEMPIPDMPIDANAKVFTVTGKNFAFSSDEIRVKKGDTVVIKFTSTDGFHDWVVDEFDARTGRVQTGGTTQVTFVADKTGTYEYYCSVGSHRANGMVGTLIVE